MLQVKIVPVTAFQQNCSILWDSESKEAVLIDAGGEPEKLQAEVETLGLTVKALWLTHGHLDHAGAVGALSRIWNVPVIGPHKEDQFWLDMLQDVSARYGFPIPEPVNVTQWLEGGAAKAMSNTAAFLKSQGRIQEAKPDYTAFVTDSYVKKAVAR